MATASWTNSISIQKGSNADPFHFRTGTGTYSRLYFTNTNTIYICNQKSSAGKYLFIHTSPTHTAAAVKAKAANKDVSRRLAYGPENFLPETFKQTSLEMRQEEMSRDEMVCDEA